MNRMTRALWSKAVFEARWLTLSCAAILFSFALLFVWITGLIKPGPLEGLLQGLPEIMERLSAIPFTDITTPIGKISVLYVDPVVLAICGVFAVARGSAVISGEIDRGTMEMLLARPIPRMAIVLIEAAVGTIGAGILAASLFAGVALGLYLFPPDEPVYVSEFLLPSVNLFTFTFAMLGIATMCSSWERYRGRTVGLAGGFLIIELMIKALARLWLDGDWLFYLTILTPYEPQLMIRDAENAVELSLRYNGTLLGLGLAGYFVAAVIFTRRDLPAPL